MTSAQDFLVAKFALKANLLATDALQQCLLEQRQRSERGQTTPLVQILVQHRLLSREQLVTLMRAIELASFDCDRCRAHYPYSALQPSASLACPRCHGSLKILKADGEPVSERLVTGRNKVTQTAARAIASQLDTRPDPDASRSRSSGGASRDGDAPPVPRTFGPYEILSELGRGGMGVVYKARRPGEERAVALKVLLAGNMASKTQIKRFQREAELAGKLHHPGIVPILDVGQVEDRHYFTMEFVEGEPLEDLIKKRELSVRQAVEITRDIARALAHAHAQGVVHRDVKPANIIIDAATRPHVMDFGLAKDLDSESPRLTREGAAVGTPFYMSPEQAKGERAAIGPASDIYSLGVVCFELLTFDLPFKATTQAELTRKILNDAAPRPSTIEPAIEPDVELVVLKALAKDPKARYAGAEEMAEDLDRWLRGERVAARPSGLANRLRTVLRRHKDQLVPALVILGTLGAIATGVTLVVKRFQQLEAQKQEAERRHQKEVQDALDREARDKAQRETERAHDAAARSLKDAQAAWSEVERIPTSEAATFFEKLNHVIALASEALGSDPSSTTAYLLRARAREIGRQLDVAAEDYAKARALDPKGAPGAEATYREARLHLRRTHDTAAAKKLFAEIEGRGDGAGVWGPLAHAAALLLETPPRIDDARAAVDVARARDPECPEVYYVRALTALPEEPGFAARPKEALEAVNACLDGDRKNARAYAMRARIQLALGHGDLAQEDVRSALALDPDDGLARLTHAQLAINLNRPNDAIDDLERIVKSEEPHEPAEILLQLATLLAQTGRADEARPYATRAEERAPDSDQAYTLLAGILARNGQYDLAITELETGIARCAAKKSAVEALITAGIGILSQAKRLDDAEKFVQEQVARAPDELSPRLALAEVYVLRGGDRDAERALAAYEELHGRAPLFIAAWKSHAHFLLLEKKVAEALALVKRLTDTEPGSAAAWTLASTIQEVTGHAADARAAAEKAVSLEPKNANALTRLAQIDYQERDLKSAEKHATSALEQDPACAPALTILAAVGLAAGRSGQEIVANLTKALELDATDSDAAYFLAMIFVSEAKYDFAARVAERTLALTPFEPSPKLLEALGIAQLGLGNIPKAERTLHAALERDDNMAQAHAALAELYLDRNETDKARAEVDRALAIDPECAPARQIAQVLKNGRAPRAPKK